MSYYEERPPIKVYCKECQAWVNEHDTEFLDISEGPMGEDLTTFKHCDKPSTSIRLG